MLEHAAGTGMPIKVLFTDDDEHILDLADRFLKKEDPTIEIVSTSNPEDALQRLEDDYFDAVVVDYKMPNMTGLELLEHLRKRGNLVPFIMFTGHSREEVAIKALNLGATYYLTKSGDPTSLFAELAHIIRSSVKLKRAEELVLKTNLKYKLLFERMPGGIARHQIVLDAGGNPIDYIFLEVNDAFQAQTGLKREDIIGKRVTEVIPGIEKDNFDWIGTYGRVALTGEPVKFDQYSEQLGRWYSVSAYSPEIETFVTAFTEMTERKQVEDTLKERNMFLSEFVHAMAHDLKGSLHNIMGYAELLKTEHNPEFVDKIAYLAKEQSETLERSIELADAGLFIDQPELVDLDSLVRTLSRVGIPTDITFEQDHLPVVSGDRQRIAHIFANLFDNAIQHGNPTTIEVRTKETEEGILLLVSNNGQPIESEHRVRVFERGFSTKKQGRGLGLPIVERIVKAHGWRIRLEPTPLTTFSILIPK